MSRFSWLVASAFAANAFALVTSEVTIAQSYLYWTETDRPGGNLVSASLMRSNLDGTGVQPVITSANSSDVPTSGLAFDVANDHIYAGNGNGLLRMNLDGSNKVDLVPTIGQFGVGDVELDLVNQKVYWTEVGGFNGGVRRANLDGTDVEPLAVGVPGLVEGIALDVNADRIFFTWNGGTNQTIEVMALDGTGRSTFKTLVQNAQPHDVEIDVAGGILYWNEFAGNDDGSSVVNKTSIDGLGAIELVTNPLGVTANGIHFDKAQDTVYLQYGFSNIGVVNADGTGFTTPVSRPVDTAVNYMETVTIPEPSSVVLTATLLMVGLTARSRASQSCC